MNKQLPHVPRLAIIIGLIIASPAGADDTIKRQILNLFISNNEADHGFPDPLLTKQATSQEPHE